MLITALLVRQSQHLWRIQKPQNLLTQRKSKTSSKFIRISCSAIRHFNRLSDNVGGFQDQIPSNPQNGGTAAQFVFFPSRIPEGNAEDYAVEMSLDEWKSMQDQSRPKAEFNLRKPDTLVPSKAVVIHKSKFVEVSLPVVSH